MNPFRSSSNTQQISKRQLQRSDPQWINLRCRYKPLHDAYFKNGTMVDEDSDVIFLCGDGHQLRAHKVILAMSSKFFLDLFHDQTSEISVVSVPNIKVDTMEIILRLAYQDRVLLTMNQITEVWGHISNFGMSWSQFVCEKHEGEEQKNKKVIPQAPVPPKSVELPKSKGHPSAGTGTDLAPSHVEQNLCTRPESVKVDKVSQQANLALTRRQEKKDQEPKKLSVRQKVGKRQGSPNGQTSAKRVCLDLTTVPSDDPSSSVATCKAARADPLSTSKTSSVIVNRPEASTGNEKSKGSETTGESPPCPLCFMNIPISTNAQFTRHCNHQHQPTNPRKVNVQLKCLNCKECFPNPTNFNQHLNATGNGSLYCPVEPEVEPVVDTPPPNQTPRQLNVKTYVSAKRAPRVRKPESAIDYKVRYKINFHAPPKSKRLANKLKEDTRANAAVGCNKDESQREKNENKKQTLSFSSSRRTPVTHLPQDLGRSPIDRIESEDLLSVEAIKKALKCGVCGKEATSLRLIANCLRSHGVYRCALCFNSYLSKTNYSLHLSKCHGVESGKLKCPLCRRYYVNVGQTSKHMHFAHWLPIAGEHCIMLQGKALIDEGNL